MTAIPASPSIQIVPLTRGSVVLAGADAYACTNAADILMTVAALLPADGSLPSAPPPVPRTETNGVAPGDSAEQSSAPFAQGEVPRPQNSEPESRNLLVERENLLRLCDAWVTERISDEQFDDLINTACPDITLEEAYLTRDSFGPRGAETPPAAALLEETRDVP